MTSNEEQLDFDFLKSCREIVEKNIEDANGTAGRGVNGASCLELLNIIDRLQQEIDVMKNQKAEYVVSWREWKGVEPCGRTEWDYKSQTFNNEKAARDLYDFMSKRHAYTKLRKVTDEILEAKD